MPRFTKVAATDVPPNTKRGGDVRVLLSPRTVGSTSGFLGVCELEAGGRITLHRHPYSEEFLYVISGSLRAELDGELLELSTGEGAMIPKDVPHRIVNLGEEPVRVVFSHSPLAPRPELGHVDMEATRDEADPQVGGAA